MTARAVDWAERAWGRTLADAVPLRGGWTSDVLRLTATTGEQSVLRVLTRAPWRRHGPALVGRESTVQRGLAGGPVPAPRSLAVDPDGALAGDPAHPMTLVPGHLDLGRCDDALLDALARLMHDVHAHDPGDERPREYETWAHPAKRVVPSWTDRPALWQEAFAVLEPGPPSYDGCFLHRDLHLGNVLWSGTTPTGLVDWVETSWGPADVDVVHCASYLAMLHGVDAAQRFTAAYDALGPRPSRDPFWVVADVVGWLPGPDKVVGPWRDLGHDVPVALAARRLEDLLAATLARS